MEVTDIVPYLEPRKDMTDLVFQRLRMKLEPLIFPQPDLAECCICWVPNSLRKVKAEAYTPQLISIGPLHRGDERLEAMENKKLIYLRELAEWDGNSYGTLRYLVNIIQQREEHVRVYYSNNFNEMTSTDFIEMVLLDAVFIIKFLKDSNDDRHCKMFEPWMIFAIREDLMLLENQLPFFIIQEIYDKLHRARSNKTVIPFLDLVTLHFGKYTFSQGVNTNLIVRKIRHFNDLLRNFMLSGAIKRSFSFNPIKLKYSAVMLRRAGVKFQVTQDKCLVNITFEKGVLKIPCLEIDYCFERYVRNIMALEQCFKPFETYICNYIKFMDHLINSAEDVELLVEKGIILHWLGDDAAVSNMINKLCETINDTYTCYDDICQKMNAHYENRWNYTKATLKLVYFPNVWRGTATVAAAILLILTLIQAISSAKSLF